MEKASAEAEQRAAEIDVRQEGEVLALARRAANAGTWDLDLREKVVRYCPRSLEMLGHPPDRSPILTPQEWAEHIFPGDAERVMAEGLRARATGTDLITEYRIVRPDGGIRWVRGMGRTLVDANGEAVRSVGFNFDVTEEKAAEANFRKMQAELIQASRSNSMATLAETLAHELNQPLTVISNYVAGARSMLRGLSGERIDEVRDALDEAVEATGRAAEIVMGLRALTRRAAGDPETTMLDIVVQKAADLALTSADEDGVETRIEFVPGLLVEVDGIQLQQVAYNLVRNALDAVRDSTTKRIVVSCRREGDRAVLRVEDSGPGVREGQGAGLRQSLAAAGADGIGLDIARTIVEASGGRLSAEHLDGGTAFVASFPLAGADE